MRIELVGNTYLVEGSVEETVDMIEKMSRAVRLVVAGGMTGRSTCTTAISEVLAVKGKETQYAPRVLTVAVDETRKR